MSKKKMTEEQTNAEQAPAEPQFENTNTVAEAQSTEPTSENQIVVPEPIVESKEDPRELANRYFRISANQDSLKIEGDMPIEEFLPAVNHLVQTQEKVQFLIGDAMVYGEKAFGQKLELAFAQSGKNINTLKAYAVVSRAIPPSARVPQLSWSHHQVVASIANSEEAGGKAKAKEILKQAVHSDPEDKTSEPVSVSALKKTVAEVLPKKEKEGRSLSKRGPKTKASKAAKKEAKAKPLRPISSEETAALDQLYAEVIEPFKATLATLMDALDAKPDGKTALLDVIKESPQGDKKGFVTAMPEKATVLRLFQMIQAVEDRCGY